MAVRERGSNSSWAPWRANSASILRLVETREQHTTRLRPHGVHDRRNLINGLALAKQRLIQADSRSALKIDFELRRHARKCTKALPLR